MVALRHRGLIANDVFLAGYPKSGNTWLAFLLGDALFDVDMDFVNQGNYVPGVGRHADALPLGVGTGRFLRTHEPYRPGYRRAVYVVRDVHDVLVSYYQHHRMNRVDISLDRFVPDFLGGHLDGFGSWMSHVQSWMTSRAELHVVRYEDLRANTEGTLRQALEFLGRADRGDRIPRAIVRNSLDRMRAKEEEARRVLPEFAALDPNFPFVGSSTTAPKPSLSREQLELVAQAAGPVLERLGYRTRVSAGAAPE